MNTIKSIKNRTILTFSSVKNILNIEINSKKSTKLIKKTEKIEQNLLSYKTLFEKNLPIVRISAKTGRNIDTLIKNIYKKLPEGEPLYPEDIVTEETMRDVTEEIIREKILLNTSEEIPHSVAVKVEKYQEKLFEYSRIFLSSLRNTRPIPP